MAARALVTALAGMAIWLVTRRYAGVIGDSRLYALMALALNDPKTFGSDLFVKFGSQGEFTLFSPFYGFFIAKVGLATASIALMLAVHAFWLIGAWLLSHRLVRGVAGHASFLLLTAINATYGGWAVLHAGQGDLTSRPLAEGLVMMGVAMLLGRAWFRSAALLALAGLLHAEAALAGLGVAFIILAARWPIAFWLAPLGAAAVVILARIHIDPFSRLFIIMDKTWLPSVGGHDGFAVTSSWWAADWARVVADLAICGAAALRSGGDRRRLLIAVCLTAVAGLAMSVIGGDFIHDALIVQLQTWRMTWLLAVSALPAIVLVALHLRHQPLGWPTITLLAAPLVVLTRPFSDHWWAWLPALAMSIAGLALTWFIHRGRAPKFSGTTSRIIVEAATILPLGAAAVSLINLTEDIQFRLVHGVFAVDPFGFIGLRIALLAAALAALWMARRRSRAALAVSVLGVAAAVLTWDARTPWERYVESGAPSPLAALPPDATLLWGKDAAPTWLLLRRPVYVSATQAAGLLFSKATAVEWARRAALVRPLVGLDTGSSRGKLPACAELARPVSSAVIDVTCRRSAGLTGVVLGQPLVGIPSATFATPAAEPMLCTTRGQLDTLGVRRFSYVACAHVVGGGAAAK